jgi:photosystem II stability/assembly factor-like uncharacterized protein
MNASAILNVSRRIFVAGAVLIALCLAWPKVPSVCAQSAAPLIADTEETQQRWELFRAHQAMRAETPFSQNWQFIGPLQMTGRVTDIAVHSQHPDVWYVAGASGGVFKTADKGNTWQGIFEDYPTASIGDIEIDPQNPQTIWVGTGEANILRSTMAGLGIFKSTNGGESFEYMGLGDTHHIARIVIHPQNSDVIWVAAPGHEYTHNRERGVFKSTDGGKTWRHVFYKNRSTGSIDLVIDPSNPDTLYMSTGERLRYRWNDPNPGPQTAVWKSTDGGENWFLIGRGLPEMADCERIGLDVCRSQPNVVYALVNDLSPNPDGRGVVGANLFRSNDHGMTWERCEGSTAIGRIYASYGWFFGQVRVDPNDPETVYVQGVNFMRSTDGGKAFTNIRGNHADYHALWINPNNSQQILVGNDGGIMYSENGLETYESPRTLPIVQMYNVAISQTPGQFHAYTCIQDNMGWRGLIDVSEGPHQAKWSPWERGYGDESGRHAVDPTNPNLVYAVNRYGTGPFRFDLTAEDARSRRKEIAPDFGTERRRGQWVSPLTMSSHDPKRLLYGAQFVFLSNDGGDSWTRISDDLTNFDPNKQGNIAFSTLFAIAESPLQKGLIYAGSDDGLVHVTDDEKNWTSISTGIPADTVIASIEACRQDVNTVYLVANGKRLNDFQTYVFKSTDRGQTWTSIANGIPGGIGNVIKQDPKFHNVLYLGTDLGVYVSLDSGSSWQVLGQGLPTVYVHDIAIHETEQVAVIATHGRGGWLIDLRNIYLSQLVE